MEQVIASCKKGNNDSFTELIALYSKRLYGYYYRLTGNAAIADDLLSQLFVKLVKAIRSYRGDSFDAWLFKVASNVFYDHLRAKKRDQTLLENKQNKLESESKQDEHDGEIFDQLQKNLKKLDSDTRELIIARFYSQMSFKEIAQQRNEPIGTTLSKVHRGLKKLRKLMEK